MNNRIYEIECNFSNCCTAECIICSRPHGVGNKLFMEQDIFNILVEQLHDIDFTMIQTSGNGEAFLNPNYLDYVSTLRSQFPDAIIWTYNNFSLMTRERAERIVSQNLFDRVHVRIESLHKWIFERNSNLNFENIFANLSYFLSINDRIPVIILYNDIRDYYAKCKRILGKRPMRDYYTDDELAKVTDESRDILRHFMQVKHERCQLSFSKISHSLWGERLHAPRDADAPCPKWDVINNVTWVSPDGGVMACCYSDRQDEFVCGNIKDQHLLEIYHGERRKAILEKIKNREYTDYPCTNPRCCGFHEGRENTSVRHKQ